MVGPNDAFLGNGATFAPGKVGHAFNFDAVDDVVGADADIIGDLQQFTIEFWVELDALRAEGGQIMVYLGNEKAVLGLFEGRFFQFVMRIDGDLVVIGPLPSNNPIQAGVFHHVAARYNGTRMWLLVDGVFVAARDAEGTVQTTDFLHFSGPDAALGGLLDEITIYDRPLFFSEIQAIFNAGSNGKCKP